MTPSSCYQIKNLKKIRLFIQNTVENLTTEQLNKIPEGYNNNIIWNLAHVVAAQEGVCYLRAGLLTNVPESFYNAYKPGTRPEKIVDDAAIAEIKTLLLDVIGELEIDMQLNKFVNYLPWTTRYGVEMNNIDEALAFLSFHEGMHLGYIMALKRLV